MLTRKENVAPNQEYYADSLLTRPTTAHTVFNNFAASVATPFVALNDLDSTFAQKPEGKAIHDSLNAIEMENQTPGIGWGQWGANQVASLIGYGVNPIMWGFGEIGALGARGLGVVAEKAAPDAVSAFMRKPLNSFLGESMSKWLPEQVGKEGAEKTLSAGLVSQKSLDTFGTFAGAGVPIGIVNNFNQDTGHINWGGVARDAGEMGAFGIAIGSVPFAWGVIRGKVNRGIGASPSEPVTTDALSEALAKGNITPQEHQWYTDYLEHQKNPSDTEAMLDLQKRATEIVGKNGHKVNSATDEVPFDILKSKDVENLNAAVPDQLIADVPETYKTALSDYLIHNRLDEIRENPEMLDGVRGYVDHINQKLEMKSSKLAESDKILDDHMLKGVNENMPFSQKELFKHMRQAGFEASHMSQLPVTIPENMTSHLKIAERINQLKVKLKDAKRLGKPENKQTLRRIGELEDKLPKILTPKEELEHIRKTLIRDKGLPKNWERSNAYHRLLDLAHVWHNARTLLDRVHMEKQYAEQEAFKTLADHVLKVTDGDMPRLAQPSNVINYLKARIEGTVFKKEPIEFAEDKAKAATEIPQDADSILGEQEAQVKNSAAKDLSKEFTEASEKFKEFKSSESVFKNLISCVLGGMNG
jgi:hypothetical protein